MRRALVVLIAAAALASPAVAQQQDPNQNQNAQQNKPGQPDQRQGAQTSGQSDQQQSGPSPAMHPSPSQIRMLQRALNRGGLNAGPVDGIMGTRTREALQKFQSQKGLNASGQLDRQTIAALRSQATAKTNKRTSQPQNLGRY